MTRMQHHTGQVLLSRSCSAGLTVLHPSTTCVKELHVYKISLEELHIVCDLEWQIRPVSLTFLWYTVSCISTQPFVSLTNLKSAQAMSSSMRNGHKRLHSSLQHTAVCSWGLTPIG